MTDQDAYWGIVEAFLEQANNDLSDHDLGAVSDALMEAAARFSAFYAASSSETRKDLKQDKDDTIHDFGGEFKRKLSENLDDYIENYKVYMRDESTVPNNDNSGNSSE